MLKSESGREDMAVDKIKVEDGKGEETHTKENASRKDTTPDYDQLIAKEYLHLVENVRRYINDPTAEKAIEKSFNFAKQRHGKQKRKSGEPYIIHPVAVANILTELRVDLASLIAAILHDVVEDTETPLKEIEDEFGPVVASLVDGLTKIGKIKFQSTQEKLAENFRKMVLAMAKDLRVMLVKIADRLHNMRTIEHLPEAKRMRIAKETLDIYAPLASRLGIYGFKNELEDLCLRQTKAEIYQEIKKKIAAKKAERDAYIVEVRNILEDELRKYGFKKCIVYGRSKHFYSIYKKMMDRQLAFEDIHDLFAFRIIVDSVKECYEALGIVHSIWKPMPGRFKDYIAMPKANMYQSLHTTVIRPNGAPAEIQIRTQEMHNICEYGVAAHWAYKEKQPDNKETDLEKFSWLRQIMEWQSELKDPGEFLEAVKVDLFEDEVFVFTPKGDVIQLHSGATALDFAFAVHTGVGSTTVSAKINGKITPLRTVLKSGDIIEISTSKHQKPNKDWLNFVTTSKAKNKIRSYLRSEQRTKSKQMGSELLEAELTNRNLSLEKLAKSSSDTGALVKAGKESKLDDVLIAIGYGKLNARDLVAKAFPRKDNKQSLRDEISIHDSDEDEPSTPREHPKSKSGILVGGLENILVSFGRCCSPLPGEDIVGFITRGRGVTVHSTDCKKIFDLDPARKINVSWTDPNGTPQSNYLCTLQVITQDRHGVLADVTSAISAAGANITKAQIKVKPDMKGLLDFHISLRNFEQLKQVMSRVEAVQGVIQITRKTNSKGNRSSR
ncbi:MAG: bifunctional (p)ppGpp synthetase/guanosine-3',5'-bis(diphosphate) 3'-pyrophosphohydrolase [Bdellovibrionota bacterium]